MTDNARDRETDDVAVSAPADAARAGLEEAGQAVTVQTPELEGEKAAGRPSKDS